MDDTPNAADPQKPAPPKPEDVIKVGPIAFAHKTFFVSVATICLVMIELQKLVMLDIPISAALSGFDAVAAALGNIGLLVGLVMAAVVVVGGFLLAAGAVATLIVLLRVMLRGAVLLTPLGFWRVLILLLSGNRRFWRAWYVFRKAPDKIALWSRAPEALYPTVRDNRDQSAARLTHDGPRLLVFLHEKLSELRDGFDWLRGSLMDFSRHGAWATWVRRAGLTFVVAFVIVVGAGIVHLQDRSMYEAAGMKDAAKPRPILDVVADGVATVHAVLPVVAPEIRVGTLTFARPQVQGASHLLAHEDERAHRDMQRSEDVFYIGDFGEWAYVARAEHPADRLLIRRTNIFEFGRFPASAARKPTKTELATTGQVGRSDLHLEGSYRRTVVNLPDFHITMPQHATGPVCADVLCDDQASRMQALETRLAEKIEIQSRVSSTQQAALDQVRADTARLFHQYQALARRMFQQTRQISDTARSVASHRVETRKTAETTTRDLAQLRDEIALKDALLAEIRGLSFSAPRGADIASEIVNSIKEGVTTRTTGVINDMQRRFGVDVAAHCLGTGHLIGFVEFAENRKRGDLRDVADVIANLQQRASALETTRVLMRGGASYTGAPQSNMTLSENRAEWVKHQVLKGLAGTVGAPTDLEQRVRREQGVEIIAFGLGERLPHPQASSRAVEVTLCGARGSDLVDKSLTDPAPIPARVETGRTGRPSERGPRWQEGG